MNFDFLTFAAVVLLGTFALGHRFGRRAGMRAGFTRGERYGVIAGRKSMINDLEALPTWRTLK